jgi:biopolymer transport protein ExbD
LTTNYLTLNFKFMAELTSPQKKPGAKGSLGKMPVRVDLTAMVDLAFLLITFFMLTTSLSKPRVMPVAMPVGNAEPVPETRTMTICLGKNNQVMYFLGLIGKPLIAPALTNSGKGIRSAIIETEKHVQATTGKSMIVILKPSDHSIYANLVDALDELAITKVESYAIADISSPDIELLKQKGVY